MVRFGWRHRFDIVRYKTYPFRCVSVYFWCFIWRSAHFGIRSQERWRKVANKKKAAEPNTISGLRFFSGCASFGDGGDGGDDVNAKIGCIVNGPKWSQNRIILWPWSRALAMLRLCRSIQCQRQTQIVLHTRPRSTALTPLFLHIPPRLLAHFSAHAKASSAVIQNAWDLVNSITRMRCLLNTK